MTDPVSDPVIGKSRLADVAAHYPVVIIGAGINGCGLFRDLAAQGVNCLLIDKNDFCSGASAAPSRLIHGGIKYLETGEFRLVRQSARERNLLLKNAPHYVKPLETILPVYSWFGGIIPSIKRFFGMRTSMNDRGAVIIRIGLLLYDLFGRHFRTMPNHRMLLKSAALSALPDLTKNIVAIGIYYEGRITHAERLGLELVLDGTSDNPDSIALNHMSVRGDGLNRIFIEDLTTNETITVHTDLIINAAGAWIDDVNARLGITSRHMGGSKGSHLIVGNERLYNALAGRMIYFGSSDGRVNLLYPFMGNVLVGSTDIPVNVPDLATCDTDELSYLCGITREVFPDIEIQPEDVLMTYCGVRPLPNSEGMEPGAVSRDHSIAMNLLPDGKTPVYSLIGGKWTTFRGFSEEAADLVLGVLGLNRLRSTEKLPIGGGRHYPPNEAAKNQFIEMLTKHTQSPMISERLLHRYGTRARLVACAGNHTPLRSLPSYTETELAWICRNESVIRLTDLLFRRTDIALSGRLSRTVIDEVADIAAVSLGWDSFRCEAEIAIAVKNCKAHNISLIKSHIC